MPLIAIDEEQSYQLQNLNKCNDEFLDLLCYSAFDFLENGWNDNIINNNISHEMSLDESKIVIHGLMTLIVKLLKYETSDNEIADLLSSIQCNAHFQEQFIKHYKRFRPGLLTTLTAYNHSKSSMNRYVNLQWKFEIQVCSKFSKHKFKPCILLRFITAKQGQGQSCFDMQCTVADLYQILDKIGAAIRKNNSSHSAKLLRHIK